MSATGRSNVRVNRDVYPTPPWATRALLPKLARGGRGLEPSAGEGTIVEVLRAHAEGAA